MQSLFSLDNPVIHFLSEVGDMIIANLLFLICSIPIVTIGAGWAALHKITQTIASQEDQMLLPTFFRTFKENFKQSTIGRSLDFAQDDSVVGNLGMTAFPQDDSRESSGARSQKEGGGMICRP